MIKGKKKTIMMTVRWRIFIGLIKRSNKGDEKEGGYRNGIVPAARYITVTSSYMEISILQSSKLLQVIQTEDMQKLGKDYLDFLDEKLSRENMFTSFLHL